MGPKRAHAMQERKNEDKREMGIQDIGEVKRKSTDAEDKGGLWRADGAECFTQQLCNSCEKKPTMKRFIA